MRKSKLWLLVLITVIFFLISFYFRFPYLYEWDSVNYVRATQEFNLFLNQPHPPGYPGFVLILKLLVTLFGSSFLGFVFLMIVSYLAFALVSTLLVKELMVGSFHTGVYLFFLTLPMVLFHSLVTTIYITEGATVVCLVWVLAKVFQKKWHPAFLLLLLPGGLIKTNIPIVLLPLAIFVLFSRIEKRAWRWIMIIGFIILNGVWFVGINKMVFYLSQAPDHLDKFISNYIIRDNILSAYVQGIGEVAITLLKNLKNVVLALFIQLIPLACLLGFRSGKITIFKGLTMGNRIFVCLWILPHLLFITVLYFPKNGYLLEIITGLVILVMALFKPEHFLNRMKWLWAVNLIIFFIPLNIDYFQAKVRVSGEDKTRQEYVISQAVRIFETTYSQLRSMKKVYEFYFSEIKKMKKSAAQLFILDNIVADYRVIPLYLKGVDFLIIQKEKDYYILSFFHGETTRVKLIERTRSQFRLSGYDTIYLVTSTPSLYPEEKTEIKKTIYQLLDDSVTIKNLKILFGTGV